MDLSRTRSKVFYFAFAEQSMYDMMRSDKPDEFDLITLETNTDEERIEKIRDVEYLILGGPHLSPKFLEAAGRLRLIVLNGVGYHDYVDVNLLRTRGITLGIAPEGLDIGVSEHTIMLMLAVGKRLPYLDAELRRGKWHSYSLRAESRQLFGATVGIIGMGRIGRAVARRLKGFGVTTICYDILGVDPEIERELNVQRCSFDELLASSDIVTLHLPLTAESRHMMNRNAFAKMKRGSMLINCARGPIVDEAALAEALDSGQLGGAGLDVFETEPPAHPIRFSGYRNVVVTPHNAGGTRDLLQMRFRAIWDNISKFHRDEPINHMVSL